MRNNAGENEGSSRQQGDAADPSRLQRTVVVQPLTPAVTRSARVADQVYRHLRRAIISGEIESGARLREVEIAQALHVSRTPVREAISRLIGDLLVREHETTGVEVVDMASDMLDIHHIRESLELCAARLAADRITEAQLQLLEDLVEKGKTASPEERVRINHLFHVTIIQASGSPRLIEMITSFNEYFLHPTWITRKEKKLVGQALRDHKQIVDALRARSPDQTEKILRRHLKLGLMQLADNAG